MPTTDTQRSMIATALVVGAVFAAVGGSNVRDRMEAGASVPARGPLPFDGIIASRDVKSSTPKAPIDESTYFYQLTEVLEKDYVDKIADPRSLALGAIRGMVSSLKDPYSIYYKPEQMKAVSSLAKGTYSGIGVEVRYNFGGKEGVEADANDSRFYFPSVTVASVAPGLSAERAGIKFGDRILKVNGKWAISHEDIAELNGWRKKLDEGKVTSKEFEEAVGKFRTMVESSTSAVRTSDAVATGDSGTVELVWRDAGGIDHSAVLSKGLGAVPAVTVNPDSIGLKFFVRASQGLSNALGGRTEVTLDLRNSTLGDYGAMRECLELLLPRGTFGTVARSQVGKSRRLEIKTGAVSAIKVNLIVDVSTRGAAQVFAHALVDAGVAKVTGGDLTDETPWIETILLPDGSGYTLRTGDFKGKQAGVK